MKFRISVCLLLLLMGCKDTDHTPNNNTLNGVWLLSKYPNFRKDYLRPLDFSWQPSRLPLGFRFYSPDSAEVYRTNYFAKQERFVPYKFSDDSLKVFNSDSLGWWRGKVEVKNDSMYVYTQTDTIVYSRLIHSTAIKRVPIKKISLAAGSSWGWIITAVLYPNGKTLVTLKSRSSNAASRFFIKNTGSLFGQVAESWHWYKQFQDRDDYHEILYSLALAGESISDGDFSEVLLMDNDSSWFDHRSQLITFQNHMLGLQGYAFNKILSAGSNRKGWQYLPDSIACDSIRKMDFPILQIGRGLKSLYHHDPVV